MTKDLTRGRPLTLILQFGIPILLGMLFQQLYNVVDTAIVGKFLGGNALAAVGATGSINFLVVGGSIGICSGMAIPIAQRFGAEDYDSLRKYVTGAVYCCLFFAVTITAFTVIFSRQILQMMNTPADILEMSWAYITTIFAGIPGYILYNMCSGILRSLGDSKTAVVWLVVASVVNIGLDLFFIINLRWGVFGAAFATTISQFLAGFGSLWKVCTGFDVLKMQKGDWEWSWRRIGNLLRLGVPMGLQFSITAIGSVMLQSSVNILGTMYVTATTAANKVSIFLSCPLEAMGSTMTTYGGQNVGAKKWERLGQGLRACCLLGLIYCLFSLALVLLLGDKLVMLFLDEASAPLVPLALQLLRTLVFCYLLLAVIHIFRNYIQGMGFSPLATVAGFMEMIARAGVSFFVPVYGFDAACLASPAAWIMADLFLVPAYFYCVKALKKRYPDSNPS
ncbi:MAG: MATE family efflux transporter [Clostridia bacterium]|nr:MATE family efflux transporter [Clostridia bacterium]